MILSDEVEITIVSSNYRYYKERGYVCNLWKKELIRIEDVPKNSHVKIKVECDVCKKENVTTYNNYSKLVGKYNIYRCKKCGISYRKKVFIEKYGVDNPTKFGEISRKISITYHSKTEEEKLQLVENQKNTIFTKYGEWFTKTEDYKSKIKATSLKNYGLDDYRSSQAFKEKVKNTLLTHYGVNNAYLIPDIKKKSWFGNKINGIEPITHLAYQGSYELDFIEKYRKLNITKIEPINYFFEGEVKNYHPDFYISQYNLIIEIKSNYTYNYDLSKNLSKKEACEKLGYNFLFIIDKDYKELEKIIKS